MRTIHREIVTAMIYSKDHKLLLGKKYLTGGGVYIDCWHIPGGGVDEGEDLITALKREMLEETGIDISKYEAELVDNKGKGESEKTLKIGEKVLCKMDFNVYKVQINDQDAAEIKLNLADDLEKAMWVEESELKNIKLTPPSITLFKRLKLI